MIQHEKTSGAPKSVRRGARGVWLIAGAASLLMVVTLLAVLAVIAHNAEPYMRERIVATLQDRFHARIELDSFHLAPGNSLHGEWGGWASGKGLRIWAPQTALGS